MSEQMRLCPCGLPAQSYTTESANGVIRYAIGCNDPLCHWTAGEYATEAAAIAAWNQRAGEADGIVTTQWVTDQKRELTQDTTTYRKLITQEWPDKQEAEDE